LILKRHAMRAGIAHVAYWVEDLEAMRDFYVKWFGGTSSDLYTNPSKGFESFFITLPGGGARIELMRMTGIGEPVGPRGFQTGLAHLAVGVGDRPAVDSLTEALRRAGFRVNGEPRVTGDGYYESVVEDPEGNLIEITE
jgi:lactoylglutathione lyase